MKFRSEQKRLLYCSLPAVIGLGLIVASAAAQEFRGSITGRVTDPSGAIIQGSQVTVTNSATNVSSSTTTNEDGIYTVLYLAPAQYTVMAEMKGFKKLLRTIEVRVGDKLTLDLPLEVGSVTESVNIATEPPLETNSATAGQVIDRRRISELPLSDGNPFTLVRLAPGIGYIGDLKFSRPFDNNGSSDFIADGVPRAGGHEFTLDGIPNTDDNGTSGNRVAFIPPADAVQEFKVETLSFDAQQAHGAGATVNVALKTGTNSLHGTLYEFIRNDVLSANDYFLNRAGTPRPALRYNRFGGTVGGPIMLPRFGEGGRSFYDGRNKSFFFFAYEGLRDVFPEPRQDTVPTLAERNGDLSALLKINSSFQIFNPFSARQVGSRIQRDPFGGNIIPGNLISPIAKAYLQFYPLPNQAGDSQGRNNYISGNPRTDTFHSESYRFDQTISERQRFFFRFTHNNRVEARNSWAGVVNSIKPTGNFLTRRNDGFSFDDTYTFSATAVLDFRVGFSRFYETNVRQNEGAFDPKSLGFSPQSAAFFGDSRYLPQFAISGTGANSPFTPLGDSRGDIRTHNIYAVQPTLTKIFGKHAFKMGYDFRAYRENSNPSAHAAGRYDFGTTFTRGPLDNSTAATIGQDFASFLLGLPTGGFIDRNTARSNQTLYNGVFFQDDWKVNSKLTLNLGLRYEMEGATTERYNRNIRGFDPNVSSPIEAAAKAAYAANPIAEIPANSFSVKGGLLFADAQHRGFWNTDKNNFQPRIGFAYTPYFKSGLLRKIFGGETDSVVRGGFGIYMAPFIIDGVQQTGFSQSTSIVPTLNNGLTFAPTCATCGNLFNPFPTGVADPPGASLGFATFLGRGLTFIPPLDRVNAMDQRWELSVQRQLPGNWLVEVAYIGNRGYDISTNTNIPDAIPRQYLSTSGVRDQAVIDRLGAIVTNPFQGLIPGQTLNGSTTSRGQLLRPFPEFTSIASERYDGRAIYHAGQFRLERRFIRGFTLLTSYTWSKVIDELSLLNDTDTKYERRIGSDDIPHRVVVSGIWELPFGKGRKWGHNWNGVVNAILGGWQAGGIYQWQSGRPINLDNRNVYFNCPQGAPRTTIKGSTVDATFDTSCFYFHDAAVQTNGIDDPVKQRADTRIRLASNIRTFPSRLSRFRGQPLNLWDLSLIKNFSITEKVKLQTRAEFLNAFNHPQFADPNTDPTSSSFGKTTGQNNLPRNVQIGLKLIF
jgi:hypothetical protein